MTRDLVLAIAPGAAATELALFRGPDAVAHEVARDVEAVHPAPPASERLTKCARVARAFLARAGVSQGTLAAVAGRCGVVHPVEAGTYLVDDALLRDLERVGARGVASLGASLVKAVAEEEGCPAFVVDPSPLDELDALARYSGVAGLARQSACDTLALRTLALRHARSVDVPLEELRLVVAHLGFALGVGAFREGRVVDLVGAGGDGPFSGESCGRIPAAAVLELCEAAGATPRSVRHMLLAEGGLLSYAGTRDVCEAAARADRGDGRALVALEAMAYGVAKAVGELAVALAGEVNAVVLGGRGVAAAPLVNGVCRRVEWIAPVFVQAAVDELAAVAEGARRVLAGEEPLRRYD